MQNSTKCNSQAIKKITSLQGRSSAKSAKATEITLLKFFILTCQLSHDHLGQKARSLRPGSTSAAAAHCQCQAVKRNAQGFERRLAQLA